MGKFFRQICRPTAAKGLIVIIIEYNHYNELNITLHRGILLILNFTITLIHWDLLMSPENIHVPSYMQTAILTPFIDEESYSVGHQLTE